MSTADAAHSTAASPVEVDDDAGAQGVATVHSCARIGRRANPPGFSFLGWFRFGFRRRGKSASHS
jgi:hypothetical protein